MTKISQLETDVRDAKLKHEDKLLAASLMPNNNPVEIENAGGRITNARFNRFQTTKKYDLGEAEILRIAFPYHYAGVTWGEIQALLKQAKAQFLGKDEIEKLKSLDTEIENLMNAVAERGFRAIWTQIKRAGVTMAGQIATGDPSKPTPGRNEAFESATEERARIKSRLRERMAEVKAIFIAGIRRATPAMEALALRIKTEDETMLATRGIPWQPSKQFLIAIAWPSLEKQITGIVVCRPRAMFFGFLETV